MPILSRFPATPRVRAALAAALFAGTLCVGLATRGGGPLPGVGPAAPGRSGLHYSAPGAGAVHFAGRLDRGAVMQGGDGTLRIELVFGAEPGEASTPRVPTDLVVVLDRSGSMAAEKMSYAKAAILGMLEQIGPEDRFALVSYADHARVDIALSPPAAVASWRSIVQGIAAVGATHLSHGIDLGLHTLASRVSSEGRATRLVLISDGLANRGDTSVAGLSARARDAALRETTLSTVGVGNDFNEGLMTALADAGTGNYYFLESAHNLAAVFASEFDAARNTVAAGLEISITPAPGVEVVDAAGYPIERHGARVVVRPGSLFAGQERRLWVTLRAPSAAVGENALGDFRLAYREAGEQHELAFATQPVVACVAERKLYVGRINRRAWESGVASDAYAALQQRVSGLVKDGRKQEAEEEIAAFVDESSALNAAVGSKVVADQIGRASELRRDLDDAFDGLDAKEKRNAFSKSRGLASQKLRREGAYRVDPEALMKGEIR